MNQNERILAALKGGMKITPLMALQLFQCLRLSARIHNLREMGYDIKMRLKPLRANKHVAEYWIEQPRNARG